MAGDRNKEGVVRQRDQLQDSPKKSHLANWQVSGITEIILMRSGMFEICFPFSSLKSTLDEGVAY